MVPNPNIHHWTHCKRYLGMNHNNRATIARLGAIQALILCIVIMYGRELMLLVYWVWWSLYFDTLRFKKFGSVNSRYHFKNYSK